MVGGDMVPGLGVFIALAVIGAVVGVGLWELLGWILGHLAWVD